MNDYDQEDNWSKMSEVQKRAAATIAAALKIAPTEKWPEIQAGLREQFGIEIQLVQHSEDKSSHRE